MMHPYLIVNTAGTVVDSAPEFSIRLLDDHDPGFRVRRASDQETLLRRTYPTGRLRTVAEEHTEARRLRWIREAVAKHQPEVDDVDEA
jgi:hypothetical protein